MSPSQAALAYFGSVFAAGFVLGTIRVLMVAPRIGALPATLVELPFMLGASWWVAREIVGRLRRPFDVADLLVVGLAALTLMLGAEVLLGLLAFGRGVEEQMRSWVSPEGLAGLAGQFAFGVLPWLVGRRRTTTDNNRGEGLHSLENRDGDRRR